MKYLVLALVLFGCTAQQVAPPVEQTPAPEPVKCAPKSWCFVQETKDAISTHGPALLNLYTKDYDSFCKNLVPIDCYAGLIKAMSYYESGWDKDQVYTENFKDAKGNFVKSVGLLQVSIESCRSYGASAKTTEELMAVDKNLECGVKILSRWLQKDGVIAGGKPGAWLGGSRYWAVLRNKVTQIQARMK